MKKQITREEVASALADYQSIEFESTMSAPYDRSCCTYYLHITDDGEIVNGYMKADESFHVEYDYAYLYPEIDWEAEEEEYEESISDFDPSRIYDAETLENEHFAEVVDELLKMANDYLKNLED